MRNGNAVLSKVVCESSETHGRWAPRTAGSFVSSSKGGPRWLTLLASRSGTTGSESRPYTSAYQTARQVLSKRKALIQKARVGGRRSSSLQALDCLCDLGPMPGNERSAAGPKKGGFASSITISRSLVRIGGDAWRRFSEPGNRAGRGPVVPENVVVASALTIPGSRDDGFVVSSCPHKIHRYSSLGFRKNRLVTRQRVADGGLV